ncbi:MAG: VPLPA-CTERM sorting domain-containing protein [Methylococcaceae bacterium]
MTFKISKKIGFFSLILLAQTATITTAQAARTDFFDHDTYTTDSISGLDWRDVTASVGRSYNDVSSQFGTGGDFEGWKYATGAQFNALVTNYTGTNIAPNNTSNVFHQEEKIDGLVSLLGNTLDSHYLKNYEKTWDAYHGYAEGSGLDYTWGLLADSRNQSNSWLALLLDNDRQNSYRDYSDSHHSTRRNNRHYDTAGSYLVRDTVPLTATPLPASVWLMISGVLGVVGLSRKNKTQLTA